MFTRTNESTRHKARGTEQLVAAQFIPFAFTTTKRLCLENRRRPVAHRHSWGPLRLGKWFFCTSRSLRIVPSAGGTESCPKGVAANFSILYVWVLLIHASPSLQPQTAVFRGAVNKEKGRRLPTKIIEPNKRTFIVCFKSLISVWGGNWWLSPRAKNVPTSLILYRRMELVQQ